MNIRDTGNAPGTIATGREISRRAARCHGRPDAAGDPRDLGQRPSREAASDQLGSGGRSQRLVTAGFAVNYDRFGRDAAGVAAKILKGAKPPDISRFAWAPPITPSSSIRRN